MVVSRIVGQYTSDRWKLLYGSPWQSFLPASSPPPTISCFLFPPLLCCTFAAALCQQFMFCVFNEVHGSAQHSLSPYTNRILINDVSSGGDFRMGVDWKGLGNCEGGHITAILSKKMKLFLALSSAHCHTLCGFFVSCKMQLVGGKMW